MGQLLAWAARSFGRRVPELPAPPAGLEARAERADAELARWFGAAARSLSLDCTPMDTRMTAELEELVVIMLPGTGALVLTGERRPGAVAVLAPDETIAWYSDDVVAQRVVGLGGAGDARVARFCDELGVPAARRV